MRQFGWHVGFRLIPEIDPGSSEEDTMASFEFTNLSQEDTNRYQAEFADLVNRYRTDPAFRAQLDDDPAGPLSKIGFRFPPDMEVRLAVNTDGVLHIVMPPDPNVELADEALEAVAGGECLGSASTAGSVGSLLCTCLPSTAGTLSSASTAGCG